MPLILGMHRARKARIRCMPISDPSYHTCRVTFVDDGRILTLPIHHLRHITLEDIQSNRYVDYGHSWSERTSFRVIITYDRYGQQQHVEYTTTIEDICNYITIDDSRDHYSQPLHNTYSKVDSARASSFKPIWVRIPDPEEPTATYSRCSIWNTSSYAEAEKKAFKLCNQDVHYKEAVKRAQHRIQVSQQLVPLQLKGLDSSQSHETSTQPVVRLIAPGSQLPLADSATSTDKSSTDFIEYQSFSDSIEETPQLALSYNEENNVRSNENRTTIDSQAFEYSCPPLNEYDLPTDKPLNKLVDQQLLLDNRLDHTLHSSISILPSEHLPIVKEVGTQTESITSLPMVHIDQTRKQLVMTSSSHTTKYHHTPTIGTKKRTNTC